MKKLIFALFFVLISGQFIEKKASASDSFKCDGRTHCSQMTSCEEVLFFLKNCPNVKMNGNNNSFSCEKLWCKDRVSSTDRKQPEQSYSKGVTPPDYVVQKIEKNPTPPIYSSSSKCDGRTRCTQMTSCEEATFFLRNCPNVKMDGDGDGIPCEDQWCRR